jgi:hypothetical protein
VTESLPQKRTPTLPGARRGTAAQRPPAPATSDARWQSARCSSLPLLRLANQVCGMSDPETSEIIALQSNLIRRLGEVGLRETTRDNLARQLAHVSVLRRSLPSIRCRCSCLWRRTTKTYCASSAERGRLGSTAPYHKGNDRDRLPRWSGW